jgi:hypothetical protein
MTWRRCRSPGCAGWPGPSFPAATASTAPRWRRRRPTSRRDYEKEDKAPVQVRPHGLHVEGGTRYLTVQAWDFHGPVYDLTLYLVEDRGGPACTTRAMRSRYYAVGTDTLLALMRQAGFVEVERLDGRFYQPVLIGLRP